MNTNGECVNLLFEDCLIDSGTMYFCGKNYNGLFCMNLHSGEVEYLGRIPEANLMMERMVIKILKVGCELYLIPMSTKNIWVYNIDNGEWLSLELAYKNNIYGCMCQAILFKDKIYMMGGFYSGIVCIDTITKTVIYLRDVYKEVEEKQAESGDCFIRSDYVQMENVFYFASCVSNHILKLDAENGQYEWIEVGNSNNRYVGISWDGDCFWIAPRKKGSVIKWDGKRIIGEYNFFEDKDEELFYFLGIVYDGEKMYLPGMDSDRTISFVPGNPLGYEQDEQKYLMYKKYGDYLVSMKANGHLIIKENNKRIFDEILQINIRKIIDNYVLCASEKENSVINQNVFISKVTNEEEVLENNLFSVLVGEKVVKDVLGEIKC